MKTRVLGRSGIDATEIGLGCWQLGGDFGPIPEVTAGEILEAALASGIRFWDTADVYGGGLSETRIAERATRDVVVATKVGRDAALFPDGYEKSKVRANLEASLERLGVDTLDLAQLHCVPPEVLGDGELLTWMEDFRDEGLVRHIGASVETIDEAIVAASHPAVTSVQIIFNLFRQNAVDDLFPITTARNVGVTVRLPLASGVLSGRMQANQQFDASDHRNYNRAGAAFSQGETFSGVPFGLAVDAANDMKALVPVGMTMAQMAMRWVLDHDAVTTVIAGASRPSQVVDNAAVSDLPRLPSTLHADLAEIYRSRIEPAIVVPI